MQIRNFLLKLHLCQGIGCHGELQFWRWWRAHHEPGDECYLTANDLIALKCVSAQNQKKFSSAFSSVALQELLETHLEQVNYLTIADPQYPVQLKESYLAPICLFYQGSLELLRFPLLSIVGARLADHYGATSLSQLIPPVVKRNIVVVSGLAAGIDAMSHQETLRNGGRTIAVIGTGLNRSYPKQNTALQQYIGKNQLLLTEYPLNSGPKRHHFVERNRIIAGLCETLCVIQAKQHSGSLITANLALQNNRNVLAVPGKITDPLSAGCNELIVAGAKPVLNSQHIIEEFRFDRIQNMKYDY
ncbi:DNA processing protein DprA [Pediococcus cellicola]|nr:DNA processing protein DprA [Pediococcus cellicola]